MASAAARNLRHDRRCRVAPFERRMKKPRWRWARPRQRTEPKIQSPSFRYASRPAFSLCPLALGVRRLGGQDEPSSSLEKCASLMLQKPPAGLIAERAESSATLPQAQDISDDVVALRIAEFEIWHRGVRRLKPHLQRHGVHAGHIGDRCEAWRLRLGRGALAFANRVAFRANGLRKNQTLLGVSAFLRHGCADTCARSQP